MSVLAIVITVYVCVSLLLGIFGWLAAGGTSGYESPTLILKIATFWPLVIVMWALGWDRGH